MVIWKVWYDNLYGVVLQLETPAGVQLAHVKFSDEDQLNALLDALHERKPMLKSKKPLIPSLGF